MQGDVTDVAIRKRSWLCSTAIVSKHGPVCNCSNCCFMQDSFSSKEIKNGKERITRFTVYTLLSYLLKTQPRDQ